MVMLTIAGILALKRDEDWLMAAAIGLLEIVIEGSILVELLGK